MFENYIERRKDIFPLLKPVDLLVRRIMKKLVLFFMLLLLSFSSVCGEDEVGQNLFIEIPTSENVSEKDFNGVWIPYMQYLRFLYTAVEIDDVYKDDYVLIYNGRVDIQLMGNLYDKLPYKFSDGVVLSAINSDKSNRIDVTMRLITDNIMLYTIGWGGEAKAEFFCYLKGGTYK